MSGVVIVGAGPAGIAAASTVLKHGLRPVVLEEGLQAGGQGYRAPGEHVRLDVARLLGADWPAYMQFHAMAGQVLTQADFRSQVSVWAVHDGHVYINGEAGSLALPHDALILATGAIDRIDPIAGWTLPGVYALGAAQVLLKSQGHMIGRRVVFAGSSPLLYLAAYQYNLAGAQIAGVLDTTPFAQKLRVSPKLAGAPAITLRGLGHMRALKTAGISIKHSVRLLEFSAGEDGGVAGVRFQNTQGAEEMIDCDAVAFGFGLRPETQLADLAGCRFRFDDLHQMWLPDIDRDGHAGNGIYLAGDSAAIGGAVAAQSSGRLAALAALKSRGHKVSPLEIARLRFSTARLRYFQRSLARAFGWPPQSAREIDDDTYVCRCESIKAKAVRATVRAKFGPVEINRVKALTRCGMGRCQGRYCELAVARVAADVLGQPVESLGRLRAQPPAKPLALIAAGRRDRSDDGA